MRHRKTTQKFSRNRGQRKAILKSLVRSMLVSERMKTTSRKARAACSKVEQLVNLAKRNDLHARRIAYSFLGDHKLVKKLFDDIALRFKDVKGGCTRMIKLGVRPGDGAELAVLEFTRLKAISKKEKKTKKRKEAVLPEKEAVKQTEDKQAVSKGGLRQGLKKIFKKRRDD